MKLYITKMGLEKDVKPKKINKLEEIMKILLKNSSLRSFRI